MGRTRNVGKAVEEMKWETRVTCEEISDIENVTPPDNNDDWELVSVISTGFVSTGMPRHGGPEFDSEGYANRVHLFWKKPL